MVGPNERPKGGDSSGTNTPAEGEVGKGNL